MNKTNSITIVEESMPRDEFNAFVQHPMQSWEWGNARKQMGLEVLRLMNAGDSVYQITFHKVPRTPFTIGYLPRSTMPTEHVLYELKRQGKLRNCIFIKIEPYVEKDSTGFDISDMLSRSPHPLFPDWTQMLDLNVPEELLFKNLKPKTRYNVRLAQKKGVYVREQTDDQGFETFSELYFQTTERQKYHGHNRSYHRIVFENLRKDISKILIAYYNDEPLAAYHLFLWKDRFYYPYGGSSTKYKNFMAANLLMWESILFGKKLGAKKYDMWGSQPPDNSSNSEWSGFTKFKEGYGTEYVQFVGSYDLVLNTSLYALYNVAAILRKNLI